MTNEMYDTDCTNDKLAPKDECKFITEKINNNNNNINNI